MKLTWEQEHPANYNEAWCRARILSDLLEKAQIKVEGKVLRSHMETDKETGKEIRVIDELELDGFSFVKKEEPKNGKREN